MAKKKKNIVNVVYSTNPDFSFDVEEDEEQETLSPNQQLIYISHSNKGRKGKTVTLIEGFIGSEEDLNDLAKMLKNKCGVGGAVKEGEILIQGKVREKVKQILVDLGYKCKLKGG
jgi:translation initiation factor 1